VGPPYGTWTRGTWTPAWVESRKTWPVGQSSSAQRYYARGMATEFAVSVVAATHNRAARLRVLLEALAGQTIGTDAFEVIVVDDGSRDETPELLATAAGSGPLTLRALANATPRGPAAARNLGWRAARGRFIAFTDDDCRPDPGWLEALLAASSGRPDRVVQGRTQPDPREIETLGPFSKTLDLPVQSPHYETCNILYPRAVLESLDGFDETYPAPAGEDTDLGWRAAGNGIASVFAPDAVVSHAVHQVGPAGTLRTAFLAAEDLRAYKLNPELRQLLVQGVFYRRTHPLLLQALLAAALTRRTPAAALFALPYLLNVAGRVRKRRGGAHHIPFFVLHDTLEVAATATGAIRHRVPVI
jgi:GT2 family glycosyltransferase